jgi:molecular chaperone GrpE
MQEAADAVEGHADALDSELGLPEPEHATASQSSTDLNEALTESIIKAKHELEEALVQTKRECERLRENWLRSAADLENFRKRTVREREDHQKFANEKLLKDFLPIIDDIERAIDMAQNGTARPGEVVSGVQMIFNKFLGQLKGHGVSTFEAAGESFDPSVHEAVQQVRSDKPAGQVVDQLQRGFKVHDRLLRPALVTVSVGAPSNEGAKE